ncbi:hypothetical protein [Enterococcus sp. AZ109]|uniref:hypothetical protein n=1 Tax=Enterococcus sp. AZ109 TaxID=2774634 RepID=UPI003F6831A7
MGNMAGEINEQCTIEYAESFKKSLRDIIAEWESDLLLPEDTIKKYVYTIYTSIQLLRFFPELHEDVAHIYRLNEPTYRILIGKSFAIFYRLDQKLKIVQIGHLLSKNRWKYLFDTEKQPNVCFNVWLSLSLKSLFPTSSSLAGFHNDWKDHRTTLGLFE